MSGGKEVGEIAYLHLTYPSGCTEQLKFLPGIKMDAARDMYPKAIIRRMTPAEIEAYRKKRFRAYEVERQNAA